MNPNKATKTESPSSLEPPTGFWLFLYRANKGVRTSTPYLMFFGIALWLVTYYLFNEGWKLPLFNKIPGPVEVITEWISRDPTFGMSLFTEAYHTNIYVSCQRILIAFSIATSVARKMIGVSKPENMMIASGTQARIGIGRRVSRMGKV